MEYLKSEAEKPEEERGKGQITGFGAFDVRDHASRKGRNPNTGETIFIESRKLPHFRPEKFFREALE